MDSWRIIPVQVADAFTNMAVDEAILESRIQGNIPNTIRFYRWKPSAVSIGRFQSIEKEVNLEACKKLKVDVVRRVSGGGAVYHDYSHELTYSVVIECSNPKITSDVLKSYKGVCDGILTGLGLLGVAVELEASDPTRRCPNIMIHGRKVSGNAQARRGGVLLQHGTVLLDLDVKTMLTVLNNPKITMNENVEEFIRDRITTLSRELNRDVSFDEVASSLKQGFSKSFGADLVEEGLSDIEISLAEELRSKRYSSEAWNGGIPPPDKMVNASCFRPLC